MGDFAEKMLSSVASKKINRFVLHKLSKTIENLKHSIVVDCLK